MKKKCVSKLLVGLLSVTFIELAAASEEPITNARFGRNTLKKFQKGGSNSAFGFEALSFLNEGEDNSALGALSMSVLQKGSFNSAIGYAAGSDLKKGDNNIYIGKVYGQQEENNMIYLGSSDHKNCFIGGIFGSEIGKGSRVVVIDDKGKLASSPVSYETLMKIEKMLPQLEAFLQEQEQPGSKK